MSETHWQILTGDVRETLATLEPQSVQTCVTSPPYWGLRDYGHAGQIGLEATPEAYVAHLVDVFRLVRTALKDDGTLWLNLGDSYATGAGGVGECPGGGKQGENWKLRGKMTPPNRLKLPGLKPKDLVGIPWRVAFALQADGWYLRSDIIWSKPNPMPESVTDRPTKAHEYIFLLSKQATYYYDAEAIGEPIQAESIARFASANDGEADRTKHQVLGGTYARPVKEILAGQRGNTTRNKRSMWHVATQPYPEAHFATFPEALIEPCILAGTSEKGQCPACGKAWVRVVEREAMVVRPTAKRAAWQDADDHARTQVGGTMITPPKSMTTGWQPQCACHAGDPVPQMVLDPFTGSGTTGAVSVRHQRNFIGCELSPAYVELARTRIGAVSPLFAQDRTVAPAAAPVASPLLGLLDVV